MKILYISTAFPICEEGSTIYTDLAEELDKEGHKIIVAVAEGKNKFITKIENERGFEVLRIKVDNYYNVGFIKKGLASITISNRMIKGLKKHLRDYTCDLILFESPPVTMYKIVRWAMRRFRCPSYLMLKDIFPQNGVDLGIYSRKSIIFKYFRRQEKKMYCTATYIGCMSDANRQYILKHNKNLIENKVGIFPNTKKICEIPSKPDTYIYRKKYGIPELATVFLFGGNMGKPQALDFLAQTIIKLKNEKNIFFAMIGRGNEKQRIKDKLMSEGCKNFIMLDNMSRDEYEQFALECDVGLILLDYNFTIPNYPSRILTYMEYSMPILSATDKVTDVRDMIQRANCGISCFSNDLTSFVDKVCLLASDKQLRIEMGNNGRNFVEKNFDVNKSVKIINDVLN